MSTTLTNGLKLPDKGSVDWYADMQSNYAILDGAVGTVAEHTTQIAGKAPAVHTHTKADITDFPAYGNTAGTICEGNDSRLSDARTPVAHTHTKSDVTDLLNSNFIPSANNSYDLGSSSYQWNNLYAKNYYYNGVAWGLDKANVWTGTNNFKNSIGVTTPQNIDIATNPSSEITGYGLGFWDNNHYWFDFHPQWATDGTFRLVTGIANWRSPSSQGWWAVVTDVSKDFTTLNFWTTHGNANLGTSNYKWKTLNGINPGALSLPNLDSDGYTDLSGNISANAEYLYTPAYDGWLALYCQTTGFHAENAVGIFNREDATSYRWANSVTSSINLLRYGTYHGSIILPVRAGIQYGCWVVVNSSTPLATSTLFFYKAKGNV